MTVLKALATICFVLLISIPVAGGARALPSPQQSQPQHESSEATGTQKSADISAAQGTEDALARYTLWLAMFTGVLAVSTVGLWLVTRATLRHAQTDAQRQSDQMQASIAAANASAAAAQLGVAHAQDTAQRQLRAYVGIDAAAIQVAGIPQQTPITPGKIFVAIFVFKNAGQTPAYDLQCFGELNYVAWPINQLSLTAPNFNDPNVSRTTLGPGNITKKMIISASALTVPQHVSLNAGTHALVAHGEARYRDAFGVRRTTKYRFFVGGPYGIQGVGLGQHAESNDSD